MFGKDNEYKTEKTAKNPVRDAINNLDSHKTKNIFFIFTSEPKKIESFSLSYFMYSCSLSIN